MDYIFWLVTFNFIPLITKNAHIWTSHKLSIFFIINIFFFFFVSLSLSLLKILWNIKQSYKVLNKFDIWSDTTVFFWVWVRLLCINCRKKNQIKNEGAVLVPRSNMTFVQESNSTTESSRICPDIKPSQDFLLFI